MSKNEFVDFKNQFCTHDSILDGFDIQELIDTVYSNEPEVNEQTVTKVFNELLKAQIEDAKAVLKANMKNIIKTVLINRD